MRIAALGVTGGTGRAFVEQALAAGHEVTAAARRPEAVPARDRLTVHEADVRDTDALAAAFTGVDAVVSVVGVSGLRQARRGTTIYSAGTRSITAAMARAGVRRLVVVSSGGVEPQPGDSWFYTRILKPHFLEAMYADMRVMEAELRDGTLDWTVVRPGYLRGDAPRTDYRTAVDAPVPDDGPLSRWSLAHLLLHVLDRPELIRHTVSVAS